jgi:hypothetical protein
LTGVDNGVSRRGTVPRPFTGPVWKVKMGSGSQTVQARQQVCRSRGPSRRLHQQGPIDRRPTMLRHDRGLHCPPHRPTQRPRADAENIGAARAGRAPRNVGLNHLCVSSPGGTQAEQRLICLAPGTPSLCPTIARPASGLTPGHSLLKHRQQRRCLDALKAGCSHE